ncbi:GNAT family N-acetyltransferase [Streptomyces sp. NPDC046866]|uniref:GNAT family N-acetyltransferase n=1 Tax=Streptomyces sp. NPDC046866 TaxID=3154921 RepID=UPI003451149C
MTPAQRPGTRPVEGLGQVLLRPVEPARDAELIHGWVSEERARFWGMAGASRRLVQEIYEDLDRRDTHHAFLALLDGVPAALFQSYDCTADRVCECYTARPGDVGVHLLIGPAAGPARPGFTGALLDAFLGHLFALPGTRRLVAEPDARNAKAVARLERAGFVRGPEVELPEIDLPEVRLPAKRARLLFLDAPPRR